MVAYTRIYIRYGMYKGKWTKVDVSKYILVLRKRIAIYIAENPGRWPHMWGRIIASKQKYTHNFSPTIIIMSSRLIRDVCPRSVIKTSRMLVFYIVDMFSIPELRRSHDPTWTVSESEPFPDSVVYLQGRQTWDRSKFSLTKTWRQTNGLDCKLDATSSWSMTNWCCPKTRNWTRDSFWANSTWVVQLYWYSRHLIISSKFNFVFPRE